MSTATTPKCRMTRKDQTVYRAKSRLPERLLSKALQRLQNGQVEVSHHGQPKVYGQTADLVANVEIHNDAFFREIALGGSLGAAEAYLEGYWSTNDLTTLLRIMCRNLNSLSGLDSGFARIGNWFARQTHRLSRNSKVGSQRNIAAHYDLSNEFFRLFLDPTLMYSSAMFSESAATLDDASVNKLETICRKLNLRPNERVVEIGTGWGGFAVHAAANYGVHVTTTTISKKQHEVARQRIEAAGLQGRVELLLTDYRDLFGTFDKLVSIEMIEAVGHEFLPEYFSQCDQLLKPGGQMLIQAITMPDQRYETYLKGTDFIQKYIFPGGHLPSISAMQNAQNDQTRLRLTSAEQFPDSYALTLREWRHRFFDCIDDVRRLGFDDRFIRMWEYYLCYCEAAFLERSVSVGQFVWEKAPY